MAGKHQGIQDLDNPESPMGQPKTPSEQPWFIHMEQFPEAGAFLNRKIHLIEVVLTLRNC